MTVFLQLTTFAQAAPDELDATPGKIAAGLIVMGMMAASVGMIIVWWQRRQNGEDLLPAAHRKPLRVSPPLMILGLAFSSLLALMTLLATASPDAGAPADEQLAADVEPADETPGPETAEDSTTVVDEAGVEEAEEAEKTSPIADIANFRAMLQQTLMMNAAMFIIFGMGVYASQLNHSRQLGAVDRDLLTVTTDEEFDKLASGDFDRHVESPNPYAAPFDPPRVDSNTVTDSQAAGHIMPREPWQFTRELRFAAETCLVAYLPTTIARLVILGFLPEAPSHPFLEMLDNGVDWTVLTLIAVMAVVVAPLVEELLYRVTILGGIWQQHSLPAAWIVSSVLFGFAHGFPDSIALLPLAFMIGYAYFRRRSYRTVVLIHFLFNAFNMVIAGVSML